MQLSSTFLLIFRTSLKLFIFQESTKIFYLKKFFNTWILLNDRNAYSLFNLEYYWIILYFFMEQVRHKSSHWIILIPTENALGTICRKKGKTIQSIWTVNTSGKEEKELNFFLWTTLCCKCFKFLTKSKYFLNVFKKRLKIILNSGVCVCLSSGPFGKSDGVDVNHIQPDGVQTVHIQQVRMWSQRDVQDADV